MELRINDTAISPAVLAEEIAQHQDAPDPEREARHALAVRELLRQRAVELNLLPDDGMLDDDTVDALIAREVVTPAPDESACRTYYDSHPRQFRQGDLVMASHILFAVTDGTPLARLRARAEETLLAVRGDPSLFESLARELSNCPSAQVGGSLGQLQRDDVVPEFAAALFDAAGPGILPRLVNTRFGFHIVRIDHKVDGHRLPFETVQPRIAQFLGERVRHKALQQYLALLAGQARVTGVSFAMAEETATGTPLVR